MFKILKKMNKLLDARQKRHMVVIIFLMLIGGILESLSISVVIPVISVLLDPMSVETNALLRWIYRIASYQCYTVYSYYDGGTDIGICFKKSVSVYSECCSDAICVYQPICDIQTYDD